MKYTDTVGISGTDCGPRKFVLSSDRPELIASIDAPTRTIKVQTTNPKMQGTHNISVEISLANYPELTQYIKKIKTF